ncbi:major facilitator superfamily-like protein [Aureococcus anophagefferens]|nr:major facilitator superfamily-like protein [Aureococcus anophagefferens]
MSYGTVATREPSGAVSLQIEVGAAPRRASFWAVAYMVLLGDSVRGIFFPTLWPLHEARLPGVLLFAHGVIVAGALLYTQYAGLTTTSFSVAPQPLRRRARATAAARWRAPAPRRPDLRRLRGARRRARRRRAPARADLRRLRARRAAAGGGGARASAARRVGRDADRRHARLVAVGLVLNVVTKGSIGCYETLGVSYAQAELGLPGPVVGYYVSASGLVGVLFLLSFRPLGRLFDDVELVLYGIAVMVASCALMVRPVAAALGGGDAFQVWLTALFAMYAVGYPVGHTAVIGWFSKAMGRRPQGMLMGLFASAGSLARIVFPVCTGLVAVSFGSDAVFATLAALLGATLLIIAYFRAAFRGAIA